MVHIPLTEKTFIQDILETCGKNKKSAGFWDYFVDGVYNNLECKVVSRLEEYGVKSPVVRKFDFGEESIDTYLGELWHINAKAILLAGGLSNQNRMILVGPSFVDHRWAREWHETQENSKNWNEGWFTRLPYQERKFMMPVKSFDDYAKDISDIQLFRITHLPADIMFEDCIPTVGELYIAHPYRQGVYLPVSRYEHLIFRERIHELSKVMMALGATEIRTLQNSDSKTQSSSENSSNTSASVGVGRFGAKGAFSSFLKSLAENEKSDSIVINFKNDPIDLPKVPDGLIWYPHDKEWQHIADSRLFGNILEYEINLSSKEINLVSEIERSNIEAQAKAFFVSGSYSKDNSSHTFFKEESAKTTKIRIKFKSRKDY